MTKQQLVDKYPWLRPGMPFQDPVTGAFVRADKDLVLHADGEASRILYGRWWAKLLCAEAYPGGGEYSALALRALEVGPRMDDIATLGAMELTVPGAPTVGEIRGEWNKH